MAESKTIVRWTLLLYALTLLAYAPAILRGGFIWDDDDYVEQNANLRSARGLIDTWIAPRTSPQYYPMVFTTFWVEHQLWGTSATGYHLVNVLLHATTATLLWRLLVRLDVPAAFLAAGIFAVHPVHAESVAWITERKNVLSATLAFASALFYLRDRSQRDYVIALALFVLALLSKTVTCALPAALLLTAWWKHGRVTNRDLTRVAPFFAIGLALALFTAYWEREHVQAVGPEWDLSIVDRTLIAGRAAFFYLGKLILPFNLAFIYPRWAIDPRAAWQWAFPAAVLVGLLVLWRLRDRWGRGPLVSALIFTGSLVPALGFFNIYPMRYSFVADHFQYHASVALIAVAAIGLHRYAKQAAYAVVPILLVLTMSRAYVLADAERLWRDTLTKNPDSWMVHLNLAKTLANRGKDAEAQVHFERQAQLAPHLAETHWNLAINLAEHGQDEAALREYDRALEIDSRFPQAHFGRGNVFRARGDLAAAAAEYQRAIQMKPDYPEALFNLGLVLDQQGNLIDAANLYRRALTFRPAYARAHNELGKSLARQKDLTAALEHYVRAIEADPNLAEAHLNLAALMVRLGRMAEARQELDAAVRLDPTLQKYVPQILGTRPD